MIFYSFFYINLHEAGHSLACTLTNGSIVRLEVNSTSGRVFCRWESTSAPSLFLFDLAGILAESLFGLSLLFFPHSSALGGYVIFKVGLNYLLGAYDYDLRRLNQFLYFPVKIWVFIGSLLIFLVSLYIYIKFWSEKKIFSKKY
jgi:hypothetical protein